MVIKEVDFDDCPESSLGHVWCPDETTVKMDESLEFVVVDVKCEACGMKAKEKYEPTIQFVEVE